MMFQIDYQDGVSHHYTLFNASTGEAVKRRINGIMAEYECELSYVKTVTVREWDNDKHKVVKDGICIPVPKVVKQIETFYLLFSPEIY